MSENSSQPFAEQVVTILNTDPDGCYGCFYTEGRQCRHDDYFIDTRTGRRFCGECVTAMVQWELDGSPNPDEHDYFEWSNADG
jgi:hypothetical protein